MTTHIALACQCGVPTCSLETARFSPDALHCFVCFPSITCGECLPESHSFCPTVAPDIAEKVQRIIASIFPDVIADVLEKREFAENQAYSNFEGVHLSAEEYETLFSKGHLYWDCQEQDRLQSAVTHFISGEGQVLVTQALHYLGQKLESITDRKEHALLRKMYVRLQRVEKAFDLTDTEKVLFKRLDKFFLDGQFEGGIEEWTPFARRALGLLFFKIKEVFFAVEELLIYEKVNTLFIKGAPLMWTDVFTDYIFEESFKVLLKCLPVSYQSAYNEHVRAVLNAELKLAIREGRRDFAREIARELSKYVPREGHDKTDLQSSLKYYREKREIYPDDLHYTFALRGDVIVDGGAVTLAGFRELGCSFDVKTKDEAQKTLVEEQRRVLACHMQKLFTFEGECNSALLLENLNALESLNEWAFALIEEDKVPCLEGVERKEYFDVLKKIIVKLGSEFLPGLWKRGQLGAWKTTEEGEEFAHRKEGVSGRWKDLENESEWKSGSTPEWSSSAENNWSYDWKGELVRAYPHTIDDWRRIAHVLKAVHVKIEKEVNVLYNAILHGTEKVLAEVKMQWNTCYPDHPLYAKKADGGIDLERKILEKVSSFLEAQRLDWKKSSLALYFHSLLAQQRTLKQGAEVQAQAVIGKFQEFIVGYRSKFLRVVEQFCQSIKTKKDRLEEKKNRDLDHAKKRVQHFNTLIGESRPGTYSVTLMGTPLDGQELHFLICQAFGPAMPQPIEPGEMPASSPVPGELPQVLEVPAQNGLKHSESFSSLFQLAKESARPESGYRSKSPPVLQKVHPHLRSHRFQPFVADTFFERRSGKVEGYRTNSPLGRFCQLAQHLMVETFKSEEEARADQWFLPCDDLHTGGLMRIMSARSVEQVLVPKPMKFQATLPLPPRPRVVIPLPSAKDLEELDAGMERARNALAALIEEEE